MTDAETNSDQAVDEAATNDAARDDDAVLRMSERIAAPREAVFEFFVDPDKMLRWMGTAVDMDPVPGGRFWLNATGTDIAVGEFVEIVPPSRVVFTWGWEGSTDVPPGSSTVTVELTEEDGETVVDLAHVGLPGGAGDQHGQGWAHLFGRLVSAVAGTDAGPAHGRHAG